MSTAIAILIGIVVGIAIGLFWAAIVAVCYIAQEVDWLEEVDYNELSVAIEEVYPVAKECGVTPEEFSAAMYHLFTNWRVM